MNAPSQQGPSADFAQHSTAGVSPSSRRFHRLQELRQSLQDQISVQRSRRHDKAFVSPKITGDRTFTSRDLLYEGAGAPNPNQWRRRPSHAPAHAPMHADGAPLMSRSAAPLNVADRGDVWRDGGMRQQHVPIQHAPESAGPLISSSSQHNANSDREWRGATSEPSLGHSANVGFSDREAGEDGEGWISHSPETFTVGRRGLQQQSHKQALEQQMADNAARRRAEKEEDVMSSMVGSHPSASPNANANPPPHRSFAASIANIGQYEASQAMHDGRRGRGYRSSEAGHTNNHTMAASSTSAAHHHHGGLGGGSHGGLGSDNYRSPLSIKRELALRAGEALRAQMALNNGGGGGFSSVGGGPTTNSQQAVDERQARALQLQRIRSELEEQIREQRERKAREREAEAMEEAKFAALALASEQRSAAVVPRAAMGSVAAVSNFGRTAEVHQPLAATPSQTFAGNAASHSTGFGGGGALPPVVASGQGFGHHFQQQHAEQPTVNAPRSKDDRTLATATAFEAMRLQVAEEKRLRFLEKKRMLQQSSAAAALVSATAPQPNPLHVPPSGGAAVGGEGHTSPSWHGAPHSPHTSSQAAAFSAPPTGVADTAAAPFTAARRREEGFSATATNNTEASGAATEGSSAAGLGGRSPHHLPAIRAEGRLYETTTNVEATTVTLDQRRMIAEPAPTAFTEEDPSQAFHTATEERRRNRSVFGRTAESGIVRHATGGCDGEEMGIQCRFEGTDGGVAGSARKNTPQAHSPPSPRPNVHRTYSTYNETETTQQHISTTKMSGPPTPGRGDGADTLQQDGQHQLRTEAEATVYAAAASTAPPPPPPPRRLLLPPIASASVEAHARGGSSEVSLQGDKQKTAGGVHSDGVAVVSRRHLVLPPIVSSPAAVGGAERKAVGAASDEGSSSGRGFESASAGSSKLLPSHSAFVSTRVRSTTRHHTPGSADDDAAGNNNSSNNGAATIESIAADAHQRLEETSPCTFGGEEEADAHTASASSPSPAPAEADVITTSEVVSSAEVRVRRSPLLPALEGAGVGAISEPLLIVGDTDPAAGRGHSLPSPADANSVGFARSEGLPTGGGGFFTVGDEDDAVPEGMPFLGMAASSPSRVAASPVLPAHATRAHSGGGDVHVVAAVNAEGPAETDTTLQPQQARPNVSSDGRSSAIYGGGGARWGPHEEGVGSDGDDGGYMDAETVAIMHQRGIPMPIEMLAGAVAAPQSGTAGAASSGGGGGEEAIMAHLPSHHRHGGPSHAISPPPHIPPFPLYAPPQIIHIVQM